MSDDRYGNTRVAKIRAAYNDLRSALAEGDMGAAQAAFARYEQWSDYILDKRHSDRISALEARVKVLTEALEFYADESTYVTHYEREACDCCTRIFEPINEDRGETARAALQENTDDR